MMKRWSFSLLLGVVYMLIFHLWMVVSRSWVIASGVIGTVGLVVSFRRAMGRGYFINFWDGLLHFAVILDVLLEAVFIPTHEARGIYLCALAFTVVIGGYRFY